jgi:predicted nucleic acid-binding protein
MGRVTYWDSSAILKLYLSEPDSSYFVNLAGEKEVQVHSSAILRIEALCALTRREQAGEIKHGAKLYQELKQDISAGWIVLIPFGVDVMAQAERVLLMGGKTKTPTMLRSLDWIHLASALHENADIFVATDVRLREMATWAGLKVLP